MVRQSWERPGLGVITRVGSCRLPSNPSSPGLYSQNVEIWGILMTIWPEYHLVLLLLYYCLIQIVVVSIAVVAVAQCYLFSMKKLLSKHVAMSKISCGIFCCLNDILLPLWPQNMAILPLKSMHDLVVILLMNKISTWPMFVIHFDD